MSQLGTEEAPERVDPGRRDTLEETVPKSGRDNKGGRTSRQSHGWNTETRTTRGTDLVEGWDRPSVTEQGTEGEFLRRETFNKGSSEEMGK